MIKTRIASAVAASVFGLAALGGTFLAVAAPANASTGAPSNPHTAGSTSPKPASNAGTADNGGNRGRANSGFGNTGTTSTSVRLPAASRRPGATKCRGPWPGCSRRKGRSTRRCHSRQRLSTTSSYSASQFVTSEGSVRALRPVIAWVAGRLFPGGKTCERGPLGATTT